MFDSSQLLAFLGAVILLVLVPGPNTMIILAQGLWGRAAGLATVAGIELGTMVHTFAAALGLAALLAASPLTFSSLKFAGVAYLIVIGIRMMAQQGPQFSANAALRPMIAFRRAFITNVLNPRSAIFFLAFLPQFVRPERGHLFAQFVLLGIMVSGVGVCIGSAEALAAGSLAEWLRRHRGFQHWQNRIAGTMMVAVAIWIGVRA